MKGKREQEGGRGRERRGGRKREERGKKQQRKKKASETAQWVRVLATKTDNLSLVRRTYNCRESINFHKLFPDFHV